MRRALTAVTAVLMLTGCWPALKVVQPRAQVRVEDAGGTPIEGAAVTFVRSGVLGQPVVLAKQVTDSAGTVKLPLRLEWHMQIMLPDAVASYSWSYCVEKPGYGALLVPLERWQRPSVAVLRPAAARSLCVAPDDNYPALRVSDEAGAAPPAESP